MSQEHISHLGTEYHYKILLQNADFISVFSQMPNMGLVLNQNRQVVYGNQALLDELGLNNIEESLNLRPGELLKCINTTPDEGCGKSLGCRHCGALSAIEESQTKKSSVTREARVTVRPASKDISLDIKVTASPLSIKDLSMTMVFFSDISDQKRREYMEEIFLHDARNTLSALQMQGELMGLREIPKDLEDDLDSIQKYLKMLADDFEGHQLLINAEKGILQSQLCITPVQDLVYQSVEAVSRLAQAKKVNILANQHDSPEYLLTDPRLARRILVNALKNAIEATPQNGEIIFNVSGKDKCTFKINNPGFIAENVQKQIFQRSFSTKGTGRGLGTYSMRLLLENYLEGKVTFSSDKAQGTTFVMIFPEHRSQINN